jgi:hypothetical protein
MERNLGHGEGRPAGAVCGSQKLRSDPLHVEVPDTRPPKSVRGQLGEKGSRFAAQQAHLESTVSILYTNHRSGVCLRGQNG